MRILLAAWRVGISKYGCRLYVAIILSLSLHVFTLAYFNFAKPKDVAAGTSILSVQLSVPAESKQASQAVDPPVAPRITTPAPLPIVKKLKNDVGAELTGAQERNEAVEQNVELPQDLKVATQEIVRRTVQQYSSPGAQPIGQAGAYQRVELEIEVFSGTKRTLVGRAKHRYVSENGLYGVSVQSGADEQVLSPQTSWSLSVSGNITRQGLSPTLFEVSGVQGERLFSMGESDIDSSSGLYGVRKGRVRDGILDRQSLLYQFMLKPPLPDGGTVILSDGKQNIFYKYSTERFEKLSVVPLGEIRTVKLVLSSVENAEKIELWLIPELHYLPVKMLRSLPNGESVEIAVKTLDYR